MRKVCLFVRALVLIAAASVAALPQNLKVDEIIAKHLDAIGAKEKRRALKTLMVAGVSEFESKVPPAKGGGKVVVVSDPNNLFFLMSLNSKEYPFERVGFFDGKVSLPFVTTGRRSPLGAFLAEHEKILSNGLFGGTMSLGWALADLEKRNAKVVLAGTRKIDGRKAYMLEYYPPGGASTEFVIRIYIDCDTFYHVRTEYQHEVAPKAITTGNLDRQTNTKLVLIEDFSDFRTIDGLTYPHAYKADLQTTNNSGVSEYIWGIKVNQYYFDQKLAPDFFTFDVK